MAIERSGPVPPYWTYLAETILIPSAAPANQGLLDLQTAGLRWVHVPTYQRGISWQTEEVTEFLDSDSILLGNVILSQFPTEPVAAQFPMLPAGVTHYHVLIDGLQRLAVGTILLALLHPRYLSDHPTEANDAHHFAGLRALVQARAAAYLHNDVEFQNHPRKAISDQYSALRESLEKWLTDEIAAGRVPQFASSITKTMTAKQIAIDAYFNFPTPLSLMNTFLGLNTVRVDLGPVDLLRSFIIEKATSDGWASTDIEDVENQFTEVFTRGEQPDSELLPFVKVLLDKIRSTNQSASLVFPSWSTTLERSEVDRLLRFVADMKAAANNPYFTEIRLCGSNPFAILLAFYYRQLVAHGHPASFLTNGPADNADLHQMLLACYRVLLDGRIGRTRDFAARALNDEWDSLAAVADAVSQQFLLIGVDTAVDGGWLRSGLLQADKNRAKRIFNAMLLPTKDLGYGGTFTPLPFGRRTIEYHIDHLIPDGMLDDNQPGAAEGQGIRNFAPLPSNQNQAAKATSCSTKLGPNGIYDTINMGGGAVHAYCIWLVNHHAPSFTPAQLDQQALLELNSQPGIGDARMDKIASELLARL